MGNVSEEFYNDINVFFEAIRNYASEINGTVQCADKVPYIGFVVFYEGNGKEDVQDEKAKHFLIDCKHVANSPNIVRQALRSYAGKIELAKSLEPKKN